MLAKTDNPMKSRLNTGSRPTDALSIWTIYQRGQAGRRLYVAKQTAVDPLGYSFNVALLQSDDLVEIREELRRRGLGRVAPQEAASEPEIVEVWL